MNSLCAEMQYCNENAAEKDGAKAGVALVISDTSPSRLGQPGGYGASERVVCVRSDGEGVCGMGGGHLELKGSNLIYLYRATGTNTLEAVTLNENKPAVRARPYAYNFQRWRWRAVGGPWKGRGRGVGRAAFND
jgi:hypothetical protein